MNKQCTEWGEGWAVDEVCCNKDRYRFGGINSMNDLATLGQGNLKRVRELLQERALEMVSRRETDRDDREKQQTALAHLEFLLREKRENKPFLPRLRNELFCTKDEIRVYLGDTLGTADNAPWVSGTIIRVEKALRPEWRTAEANSGYFWQSTAVITSANGVSQSIVFSTTEPRVLLRREYDWLQNARTNDEAFFNIWCENATREWVPIWGLNANVKPEQLRRPREWFF